MTIELDKMRMLRPVQPLVAPKGDGAEVVRLIMEAVHKRKQALGASGGAAQLTMVR